MNPATIADNVGDNVGDVAGMGADLFESYVGSIIGSMVLGASILSFGSFDVSFVVLPLLIASSGVIVSIIGTFLVSVKEGGSPSSECWRVWFLALMVGDVFVDYKSFTRDFFPQRK